MKVPSHYDLKGIRIWDGMGRGMVPIHLDDWGLNADLHEARLYFYCPAQVIRGTANR